MVANEVFLDVKRLQCHQSAGNSNHVIGLYQALCPTVTPTTMTEEPQREANSRQSSERSDDELSEVACQRLAGLASINANKK